MAKDASFFDAYFAYTAGDEVPLIYHRWCAIAGVGALLGRRFWLKHGRSTIWPTQYLMLIGGPGARKDTAIACIRGVLKASGYESLAATKTTKEKFLLDLEGLPEGQITAEQLDEFLREDSDPREVFIMAGEFGEFLGYGNIEFVSLLTALWDYTGVFESRLKNSRSVKIQDPTVSILGGNTPAGFALTFPPEIIGQGFFSRLLLIYGEPTGRRITWPTVPSEADVAAMAQLMRDIQYAIHGEAILPPDTQLALDEIYQGWSDLEDARFLNYSNRRLTHLFKLCLICAACRLSRTVELQDVTLANTILTHAEGLMPRALGEFGKSRHADVSAKVLSFLETVGKPATITDIWKAVSTDLEKLNDLGNILMNLEQAENIQRVAKQGFLPLKEARGVNSKYVDFSLLPEAR